METLRIFFYSVQKVSLNRIIATILTLHKTLMASEKKNFEIFFFLNNTFSSGTFKKNIFLQKKNNQADVALIL